MFVLLLACFQNSALPKIIWAQQIRKVHVVRGILLFKNQNHLSSKNEISLWQSVNSAGCDSLNSKGPNYHNRQIH